jgi:tripartite-type tricarboxylate transporter receptor subunit TctC
MSDHPSSDRFTRRDSLAALAALLVAPSGRAQEAAWPSKPIRMVAPTTPGSGADIFCRLFSERLALGLKQTVVVDNKPGANGALALDAVMQQPADGYTLAFMSSSSTVINQAVQAKLRFDVLTDLVPIVQIGAGGIHLVVSPDFPARTLKEFIALVKARPGQYNYASWGIGSTGHLMMEWLKTQAGLDLRHVPYKSVPQIYQDMQGGVVQIAWVDATSSVSLIKSGKLRGLALSASRRGPALPDLPTLTEQGYRFEADAWYGIFAPKGTPPAVVSLVNQQIRQALVAPDLKDRFLQINMADAPLRSPQEFAAVVKADLKVWQDIARTTSIRTE